MLSLETIQAVEAKQAEAAHLVQTLKFYRWLEQQGVDYEDIKGIRPMDNTGVSRNEFKRFCRQKGLMPIWEAANSGRFIEVSNGYTAAMTKWQRVDDSYDGPAEVHVRRVAYQGKFIDILFKDGTKLYLPWPPFPQSVIYNRP